MAISLPSMVGAVNPLLAFGMPGGGEWLVLMFLGLLIFGRRLPEVSRQVGRAITEFKRGLSSVNDEIESAASTPRSALPPADAKVEADERTPPSGADN